MRKQHEGKVVRSPERMSPRKESQKTSISNKEKLKEQGEQQGEETNAQTVALEVKEFEKYTGYSYSNKTGKLTT